MSMLQARVEPYGTQDAPMAELAASCGIGSADAAARAYDLALPAVLDGFSGAVETQAGAMQLHTLATRLTRAEREHPANLFGSSGHGLSRELVEQLFDSKLASVQAEITRAAGLGTADRLIEITSLVCLAAAAGPGTATVGLPVFVAAAGAPGAAGALPRPPVGSVTASIPVPVPVPVSDSPASTSVPLAPLGGIVPDGAAVAAMPPPVASARADDDPIVKDTEDEEDEARSWLPWLLAAAVVALLLVGVVAVTGGDDDPNLVTVASVPAEAADGEVAQADPEPDLAEPAEPTATEPPAVVAVDEDPVASEPAVGDQPAEGDEPAEGGGSAEGDGTAVDFASMAEDPDIEVVAIPLRDIANPERDASGVLEVGFNRVTGEVCYGVTSNGISEPYSGHIHAGDFGVKGGIVVELGQLVSGDAACVDNLPVDTNAILANPAGHYAEVHDAGEEWTLRGQLTERVAGDIVTLSVPMKDEKAINPDAAGLITFDFNTVTGEICFAVESTDVAGPYSSHIHVGPVGVKGGIVVELGQLDNGDTACVDNLPVDTNDILADPAGHYAELHDTSEEWTVRGQLSNTVAVEAGSGDDPSAAAPEPAVDAQVDPAGGGAFIRLEQASIFLEGAVADQATADGLVASLANVDAGTPVVNNLVIDADAPLPSGRIVIADTIFFEAESSDIQGINENTLVAITALANSQPGSVLTVVGHTDSEGSDVGNLELSLRRATASRDLLIQLGLPEENLRIRGAGETAPIGDNATTEGRAQNRRIEFELAPPA